MPRYVVLIDWTDQGVRSARETTQRADQARRLIEEQGGRMETVLWTLGRHDLVAVVEAPDDETMTAVLLRLAGQGAIRTETLRAFTAEEMQGIVDRLG